MPDFDPAESPSVDVHVDVPAPEPEPASVVVADGGHTADLINHERITTLESRIEAQQATIAELEGQLAAKADAEHWHSDYVTHAELDAEPEPEPVPETVVIEAPDPEPEPEPDPDYVEPTHDGHKRIAFGW